MPAVDRDGALDGGLSDGASAPPLPSPAAGTSPAMPGVAPVGRPPCDYTATEERLGPQRTSTPDGCLETLRPEVHHREEERGKHQSGQPDHPCRPPGNAAAGDHQGAAGARPQPALSTQQHPQCAEGAHVVPVLSLAPPASCTPHRSAQHAGAARQPGRLLVMQSIRAGTTHQGVLSASECIQCLYCILSADAAADRLPFCRSLPTR